MTKSLVLLAFVFSLSGCMSPEEQISADVATCSAINPQLMYPCLERLASSRRGSDNTAALAVFAAGMNGMAAGYAQPQYAPIAPSVFCYPVGRGVQCQ